MSHQADIARLVGSSSGYVGYGDVPYMADVRVHAGYKTAKQKGTLHPLLGRYEMENFSIVLVDELEKAHPDVANAFLNALQSGEMSMSSGKESANSRLSKDIKHALSTDLRNTIFIFTSNVGEHVIATEKRTTIGFAANTVSTNAASKTGSADKATFEKALKKTFAPEFLHRIDAIVRCHSITGEHLRQIMALNVGHVNRALRDKGYFDSIRFEMTPEFVEHSLKSAKSEEAGARAISVVMKGITARLGMALQSGKLPDEANGIIRFELSGGVPDINFYETPEFSDEAANSKRAPHPTNHSSASVRNFVEGKLSTFDDTIREVIAEYMELMSDYDPDYKPAKKFLEGRLEACGFTAEDLGFLQTSAFLKVYETTERLKEAEIIIRTGADFEPVGFRAIEKYLRASVAKNVSLVRMYAFIRVLLDRPMSRNESVVVSQHLHRLLQGRGR